MKGSTETTRRTAIAAALMLALCAGRIASAGKLRPVYPIKETSTVPASIPITVLMPKVDIDSYQGKTRTLKTTDDEIAAWLHDISVGVLRQKGFRVVEVGQDAASRVRSLSDQYVRPRPGPEATAELFRATGCIDGAVLIQYLEVNLAQKGYWNSSTGALGVGMSNSDLRGVLTDCRTGDVLWRGELYYRDVPKIDSKKWQSLATEMFSNLRIGRTE